MRDLTTSEWESELGQQIRDLRLRQNLDQILLAERAGVAVGVIKRLEGGKGSTITSLIKVLRALGRADWLRTLAPTVSISPLQVAKGKVERQRVSRTRGPRHG